MQLRPYQTDAVQALWDKILSNNTALLSLPTGVGKTVIFQELLKKSIAVKPDLKALILFNRVKLLRDQVKRLPDIPAGVFCATENSYDLSKPVTIASIKSIKPDSAVFNLIICDEVHNVDDEKGYYFEFFKKQLELNPKCKIVGVTATPFRHDGYIYGKGKLFDAPCFERSLGYFINKNYLSEPIAKQPDFQIDVSKLRILRGEYRQDDIDAQTLNRKLAEDQVRDAINRMQERKKVVWWCASINHAELIKDILQKENELAVSVHSKMTWEEREDAHFKFEQGQHRHLTFVSVIAEGYDHPAIDCVVLMSPTRSSARLIQVVGRGLRTTEGKENCLVLDYANAVSTLGPLEDPVIGKKSKGKKGDAPNLKSCPECRTYVPPRSMECPQCGFNWPKAEATKLNLTADEDVSFLSRSLRTMEIANVRLTNYVSKAGSKCYRLEYMSKNLFEPSLAEYFNWDLPFAFKRFTLRAIDLDIEIDDDYEQTGRNPIRRMPTKVEYQMDGKYPKIKRLIFI